MTLTYAKEDILLLRKSNLFCVEWYLAKYPEAAKAGFDPLEHYLKYGAMEGRDPGPEFNTISYLKRYPDVAKAGINPLVHYLRHGKHEGRTPIPLTSMERLEKLAEILHETDLFNSDWYVSQYPSVAARGVDPVLDYLQVGYREGRNPSPDFDTSFYMAEYPDVANSGQNPLVHYLLHGRNEGRLPRGGRALILERKLWGGFSRYALGELEALKHSRLESEPERVTAAWSLMAWYSSRQEHAIALDNFAFACKLIAKLVDVRKWVLATACCQVQLGNFNAAYDLLDRFLERRGFNPDICLAMSNTASTDAVPISFPDADSFRLHWINSVFRNRGFFPIQKRKPDQGLKLNNLIAPIRSPVAERRHFKISVLMPAYNASETLGLAIESILSQTWENIELIVVDDCSTDDTFAIAKRYSDLDPRVKVFRQPRNMGAYAARNVAAGLSTGEYITVHDSDDWSHPQKLESQMIPLLNDASLLGSFSHWVKVDEHMNIVGGWRPWGNLIELNVSSLLFRRILIDSLGEWDNVRVAADREFIWRAKAKYGNEIFVEIYKDVPLSFSFSGHTSLTNSTSTHVKTVFYGLRRTYREASRWWHTEAGKLDRLHLKNGGQRRHFPAPNSIQLLPLSKPVDYVFVADFSKEALGTDSNAEALLHGIPEGVAVALLHWPNYLLNDDVLDDRVFDAASAQDMRILAPGEHVDTRKVVILNPIVLCWLPDNLPTVRCQRVFTINDCVEKHEADMALDKTCSRQLIQANLEKVFKCPSTLMSFLDFQREVFEGKWDGRINLANDP